MPTLEEQFSMLIANVSQQQLRTVPEIMSEDSRSPTRRSRTVYSVGEAINQRGQNAKLGTSSNRDSGARR